MQRGASQARSCKDANTNTALSTISAEEANLNTMSRRQDNLRLDHIVSDAPVLLQLLETLEYAYGRVSDLCQSELLLHAMSDLRVGGFHEELTPMQILGPPLNGIYCQGRGVHVAHRSGLKSIADGEQGETGGYCSGFRCR